MRTLERKSLVDLSEKVRRALSGCSPRKKYLIGVSGGRDSMALLHLLHGMGYKNLVVCHLDHRLRGAAGKADARLAGKCAKKLGYAFELGEADVKAHATTAKTSFENAAREMRHLFFQSCARTRRCMRLILAHHAGDQVETCLFNFLRGSGAAGLGGMKARSKLRGIEVIRPLLDVSRAEIDSFVKAKRIPFREDATNAQTVHTRNRLRHAVLPAIEKAMGASFSSAILRAAEILREEEAWMDSLVPAVADKLSCKVLRDMSPALRRRTVLRWLRWNGIAEPGFAETQRVLALLDPSVGPAKINLPGNRHARRRSGEIFLERP